jgi:hypothetical protein
MNIHLLLMQADTCVGPKALLHGMVEFRFTTPVQLVTIASFWDRAWPIISACLHALSNIAAHILAQVLNLSKQDSKSC